MTLNKVIHLGRGPYGEIFCEIKFKDGNLSITGVEGPKRNGDCRGSCGQIDTTLKGYSEGQIRFEYGWNFERLQNFLSLWDRWHLNDLKAGSPAQRQHLNDWKERPTAWAYTEDCAELERVGLLEDPSYLHNGQPYKYGTAWLKEEVPQDVIMALAALPEADEMPAWV